MATERLTYKCRLVTPMFMGGADGRTAELRPPSIKGVLRFWWRALHAADGVAAMREKEKELFGGVFGDEATRSKVGLSIANALLAPSRAKLPNHPLMVTSKGRTFPINVLEYLAYGALEYQRGAGNVFIRDYSVPGGTFEIRLSVSGNHKDAIIQLCRIAFGFGGLGSKGHNGFGSVDVEDQDHSIEKDFHELRKERQGSALPSYPAFSSGMKLWRTKSTHGSWDGALADLAKGYREARLTVEPLHQYNDRQFIGAPLIADKHTYSFLERHAKPYFMSVHQQGGKYRGYILYLPSAYAPDKAKSAAETTQWDDSFARVCSRLNMGLSGTAFVEEVL